MPSFDFSELKKFERQLEQSPKRMNRLGIKVSENSAKRMVQEAKGSHPWQNRKGHLESDTRLIRSGAFGQDEVGAEWGVDSHRRGKVGAILEATGWAWIGKAERKYHAQWVARLKQAAAAAITKG